MTENKIHASFVIELENALLHLYDPVKLRKSPLVNAFGADARPAPSVLRQTLLDAIDALKPQSSVPEQARAWRMYLVLFHRYTGQLPQRDVARTLGLSTRHLAREEERAVQLLADYLWSHFDLSGWVAENPAQQEQAAGDKVGPTQEQELRWLGSSLPQELVAVDETIASVLKTARPLFETLSVQTICTVPANLPRVVGQGSTLRQSILNLLTAAARTVPGGSVTIEVDRAGAALHIAISSASAGDPSPGSAQDVAEHIEMAQRLLELMGGSLQVMPGAGRPFAVRLSLVVREQTTVLVVDDNVDSLELFRTYLMGSRFSFVGCRDARQGMSLAESVQPHVIVLDVMLPVMDGWEVLQRLREDPVARHIPVIVCSILPEEQLALAMGAAAYLRKPVTRHDFLAALDLQAEPPVTESPAQHQ